MHCRRPRFSIPLLCRCCLLAFTSMLLMSAPVAAQDFCEGIDESVCVGRDTGNGTQAFQVTLVDYGIDQQEGTSFWNYEVCDKGPLDPDCPSDKSLSHIDIGLGDLSSCLTAGNAITFVKLLDSAGDGADLSCVVGDGDPSCSVEEFPLGQVAKCDVVDTNLLDPGDCVVMRLTIAGETAQLGAGVSLTQSKGGPDCAVSEILGPSCEPCDYVGPEELSCLTRTAGFWGTHPHITEPFLPVSVCGEMIAATIAGICESPSEAMCVSPGRESRSNRAYAQMVRQLTAAKLNLAATAANGGLCGPEIEDLIAVCEAPYCGANHKTISQSDCIGALASFNESVDSLSPTPAPFDSPGPADPSQCRIARGNGIVIGKGNCAP